MSKTPWPLIRIKHRDDCPIGLDMTIDGVSIPARTAAVYYGFQDQTLCKVDLEGEFEIDEVSAEPHVTVTAADGSQVVFQATGISKR